MASQASNKLKYLLAIKALDFLNDTFKIIAMASGFAFNKDTHHGYSDVSASELTTASGYTAGGAALSGVAVTEDDTNDRCRITWNNALWTASGTLTVSGFIIYDDTVTTPQADAIIGYIDLGGNVVVPSGQSLIASGLIVDLT